MTLQMPERTAVDGEVGVRREGDAEIVITAVHNGEPQALFMSRYNAWRVFGMLALMLGIPLTKAAGKAIKL